MRSAALSLCLIACGGAAPTSPAAPVFTDKGVALPEGASARQLLAALRAALAERGHRGEGGECFLAWDLQGDERIEVRVGDRARSAAVSCGGFDAFADPLEGRCPFLRFFWVRGAALETDAVSFYFAPAGSSFAARPIAAAGVGAPAVHMVFPDRPEGAQVVLGVPLRDDDRDDDRDAGDPADDGHAPAMVPEENPLEDPEIVRGLQQAVARVQRCNPEGSGSLVLEWTVAPDGRVADVRALTATVDASAVECAVATLSAASFPEHEGERPVDYCVPVLLDPSLRPQAGTLADE